MVSKLWSMMPASMDPECSMKWSFDQINEISSQSALKNIRNAHSLWPAFHKSEAVTANRLKPVAVTSPLRQGWLDLNKGNFCIFKLPNFRGLQLPPKKLKDYIHKDEVACPERTFICPISRYEDGLEQTRGVRRKNQEATVWLLNLARSCINLE